MALSIGVAIKVFLNLILVPIPEKNFLLSGATGAAFATTVCHAIAFIIGFSILKKNIKLNLSFNKYIVKPMLACFIMSIVSIWIYNYLTGIIVGNMAIIIALILAVVIYFFSLFALKIFTKEDLTMLNPVKRKRTVSI